MSVPETEAEAADAGAGPALLDAMYPAPTAATTAATTPAAADAAIHRLWCAPLTERAKHTRFGLG